MDTLSDCRGCNIHFIYISEWDWMPTVISDPGGFQYSLLSVTLQGAGGQATGLPQHPPAWQAKMYPVSASSC